MKKALTLALLVCVSVILLLAIFWFNTQPVWPVAKTVERQTLISLPKRNKEILGLIQAKGQEFAPTYHDAVCTEFVIKVINDVTPLTKTEKNDIRVITTYKLDSLIDADSPIIKGVQTALLKSDKGAMISANEKVLPGDFVQFWNVFRGKAYGHCGVVLDIEPGKWFTLYSSHPVTGGYGTQSFLWPEKTYFVRLK